MCNWIYRCVAVCLVSTKPSFVPIASPAAAVTAAYSAQQLAALYASAIPPPAGHGGGAGGGGGGGSPQQIPGALSPAAAMQQAPGVFGREGRM